MRFLIALLAILGLAAGCTHLQPAAPIQLAQVSRSAFVPTVVYPLQILQLTIAPNTTNTFHWQQDTMRTHITSNACPVQVEVTFAGPTSSQCVVEWQPWVGFPICTLSNSHCIGQGWCEVSPTIVLTGSPQTFTTGAFAESGFFRLKLKP